MSLIDPKYKVAKIEAKLNEKTFLLEEIHSYPTLILYHNGERFVFYGDRQEEAIYDWYVKRGNQTYSKVKCDRFEQIVDTREDILVLFGGSSQQIEVFK
mmetsp:Transcript_17451/g.12468  ORF Transcript_17451/g.12468 Transcript_17451/m.12468 type:complete len:99 (+) Transcript_17451:178-474(+)